MFLLLLLAAVAAIAVVIGVNHYSNSTHDCFSMSPQLSNPQQEAAMEQLEKLACR